MVAKFLADFTHREKPNQAFPKGRMFICFVEVNSDVTPRQPVP